MLALPIQSCLKEWLRFAICFHFSVNFMTKRLYKLRQKYFSLTLDPHMAGYFSQDIPQCHCN